MRHLCDLSTAERQSTLERTLKAFILFCVQEFGYDLFDYQERIARACLSAIIVEPKDVAICIARQAGKTELVTLLLRFLIIFHLLLAGDPLMADRLLSCGRSGLLKNGKPIPTDQLFFGADWARISDNTWIAICTGRTTS